MPIPIVPGEGNVDHLQLSGKGGKGEGFKGISPIAGMKRG